MIGLAIGFQPWGTWSITQIVLMTQTDAWQNLHILNSKYNSDKIWTVSVRYLGFCTYNNKKNTTQKLSSSWVHFSSLLVPADGSRGLWDLLPCLASWPAAVLYWWSPTPVCPESQCPCPDERDRQRVLQSRREKSHVFASIKSETGLICCFLLSSAKRETQLMFWVYTKWLSFMS